MIEKLGPALLLAVGVAALGGCHRETRQNSATGLPLDMATNDTSRPTVDAPSTEPSTTTPAPSRSRPPEPDAGTAPAS